MITVYLGCVKSGKSTKLDKIAKGYEKKTKVLRIRSVIDTIKHTHGGIVKLGISVSTLTEVKTDGYQVIFIDEGQFFPDLAEFCDTEAKKGKKIYVGGLDSTFDMKEWPQMSRLIPKSDHVFKLHTTCHFCKELACFSLRVSCEQNLIVIGEEKYVPVCRKCHTKNFNHS